MPLDPDYWNARYEDGNTPWDIGGISPQLQLFFNQLESKDLRILIPGAGNAWEAQYLHQAGFQHVYVCDWAAKALDNFKKKAPDFPTDHLLQGDFFQLNWKGDLLIEQTFFCAITPDLRPNYGRKAADLLVDGGRIAGLLFARPFPFEGPPFGGTKEEYISYFEPYFSIDHMAISQHSIRPRLGNELFFHFRKA